MMRCLMVAAFVLALPLAFSSIAAAEVKEGGPAPAVDLPATQIGKVLPDKKDAKTLNLKDLQGKKNVVLFFFPKAMTPGCTVESCGFRDYAPKFAEVDTVVIGISTDELKAQDEFTKKENLNFPLFADPDKSVTKAFGVLSDRGLAMRKTFVIDKQGNVRKIYNQVTPAKHPEEVLTYVKETLNK